MPTYSFDTITLNEALNIRAGDVLNLDGGPARTARVIYDPEGQSLLPGHIHLEYDGRTVTFGSDLAAVSKAGGLVVADGSQLFVGDGANDRFTGGAGDDGAFGGLGADALNGGDGRDRLQGNIGDDSLVGGAGSDTIYGGQGDDVIVTNRDDPALADEQGDWAQGNQGDDEITGGAGADTLLGGQGDDVIGGGDGGDLLFGDRGDDQLSGGLGWDTLVGGAGNDDLQGGFGLDILSGGDGDDRLVAQGPEIAVLTGDAGNDTLTAAGGDKDVLEGGAGRDRFEIVGRTDPATRVEAEIRDWETGDTLHFPEVTIFGAFQILPTSYSEFVAASYAEALSIADEHISATGAKYVAAQVGGDVFVFADTGDPSDGADVAVLLVGRTLADISLINFD